MSLKFGLTIGAMWTGASAFTSSTRAVNSLQSKLLVLNQKKLSLKSNTAALDHTNKKIALLDKAITKINQRKIKLDKIIQGREKFKSGLMDKVILAGAVIAPLKVAIDFESSMADVKKVVNFDSNAEMKLFQNQITKLSKTIPLSAKGLAAIVASGGQLGIAKNKLLDFTRTTAKMSTAFDMLPDEAGDASAKLMNVFGLSVKQVGSLGDAINHLSDNTASKAKDVINVLARVGGSAKVFGLSAQQTSSLASAFLALGKPAEVSATSINALLLKLGTADKQGAKFQSALASIGLSATELKASIARDGEGAIVSFLSKLNTLDNADKMGVLSDLFGAEYADDIALLSGGIDNYTKSIGLLSDKQKYAGSMQKEFETRSKTTANGLKLLGNTISVIAINFGNLLLPAINSVIAPITTFSGWIGDMVAKFPTLSGWIAGITVGAIALSLSFSALAYAGGFVVGGYLKMANVFTLVGTKLGFMTIKTNAATGAQKSHLVSSTLLTSKLKILGSMLSLTSIKMIAVTSVTKLLTAGQWLFNAALIANPIGAIVAGVVLGATLIYKYWQPLKAFFGGVFDGFISGLSPIFSALKPLQPLLTSIGSFFGLIGDGISTCINWLSSLFTPVDMAKENLESFATTGQMVGNVIGTVLSTLLSPIRLVAEGIGWLGEKLGLLDGKSATATITKKVKTEESQPKKAKLNLVKIPATFLAPALISAQLAATPTVLPKMKQLDNNAIVELKRSQQSQQVTQHITVDVKVENPTDNIDVERAIVNAMREHGKSGTSLMDEDI